MGPAQVRSKVGPRWGQGGARGLKWGLCGAVGARLRTFLNMFIIPPTSCDALLDSRLEAVLPFGRAEKSVGTAGSCGGGGEARVHQPSAVSAAGSEGEVTGDVVEVGTGDGGAPLSRQGTTAHGRASQMH